MANTPESDISTSLRGVPYISGQTNQPFSGLRKGDELKNVRQFFRLILDYKFIIVSFSSVKYDDC